MVILCVFVWVIFNDSFMVMALQFCNKNIYRKCNEKQTKLSSDIIYLTIMYSVFITCSIYVYVAECSYIMYKFSQVGISGILDIIFMRETKQHNTNNYGTYICENVCQHLNSYNGISTRHDDVIKWNHFPRYWPYVRGIHQWIPRTKASDAELWCFFWSNRWVNNGDDDLRRHRVLYDVMVMMWPLSVWKNKHISNLELYQNKFIQTEWLSMILPEI